MHSTSPRDLLEFEYLQRCESGYDVAPLETLVQSLLRDAESSTSALAEAYSAVLEAPRISGWQYVEPDDLESILATLLAQDGKNTTIEDLTDKVNGAWLGRCAGCNLGKPIELGDYWTTDRIRSYLELANAWPLANYIPALDPMPEGYELRECWTETTAGNISGSARDDDVDYTILALHMIERNGGGLRPRHVAGQWLEHLPYYKTYTAERATYRNLVNGHPPESAADIDNPYREWIGALIRGDAFGYVNPGDPRQAAVDAYQDAALSHRANGIYGEMWSAALASAAFVSPDAATALGLSLRHIPPASRLYEAIADVVNVYDVGSTWEEARQHIDKTYGHYNWVHTISNATLIAAGLLWGDGDFTRTIALTVSGGWDTDSNGATAGSVAGILSGARGIPPRWTEPLHDVARSALAGFDNTRISDLAGRTLRVIDERGRVRY